MHARIQNLLALDGRGPLWGLDSEELNATLLLWPPGHVVPEHVNTERDVLLVCLDGSGTLVVDGAEHALAPGTAALVPRGAARRLEAGAEGLRYLIAHRRRGGLVISSPADRRA